MWRRGPCRSYNCCFVIYSQILFNRVGVVRIFGTPPIHVVLRAKTSLLGTQTLPHLVLLIRLNFSSLASDLSTVSTLGALLSFLEVDFGVFPGMALFMFTPGYSVFWSTPAIYLFSYFSSVIYISVIYSYSSSVVTSGISSWWSDVVTPWISCWLSHYSTPVRSLASFSFSSSGVSPFGMGFPRR